MQICISISLFRSTTRIFCGILWVPRNIIMDLNNVMRKHIIRKKKFINHMNQCSARRRVLYKLLQAERFHKDLVLIMINIVGHTTELVFHNKLHIGENIVELDVIFQSHDIWKASNLEEGLKYITEAWQVYLELHNFIFAWWSILWVTLQDCQRLPSVIRFVHLQLKMFCHSIHCSCT